MVPSPTREVGVGLFDRTLKILVSQEPEGFLRFALKSRRVKVIRPLEAALPSREREIDAVYLAEIGCATAVAHIEFHRRHQGLDDLAADVGEAQLRLFRREGKPVLTLVWDLYGNRNDPLLQQRELVHGMAAGGRRSSRVVYLRVNLRGISARDLLGKGPPVLWPLTPLTRDGNTESMLRQAANAIGERKKVAPASVADHLAVLWLLAEAEDVPVRVLNAILGEETVMEDIRESALYQMVYKKAFGDKAEVEAQAAARFQAETIIRILKHRLGSLDPKIRERIRAQDDAETLEGWYDEALFVTTKDDAQRLIEKIIGDRPSDQPA